MSLGNILGAPFAGVVVAATLHGVATVQAWYYFTHQNDTWPLKLLVAAVMTFETIHQALITHSVYIHAITNWGNVAEFQNLVWSEVAEVIFNGLTALLVQSFLALRVWRLSNHNKLLTGLVVLLVLGEFVAIITFTALASHMTTHAQVAKLEKISIVVNALAAAGDVLIAGSLCTLLHLSRTGFHKSDTMITRLMLFSVNTGLLTSFCALASLVSMVISTNTFIYIAFFFLPWPSVHELPSGVPQFPQEDPEDGGSNSYCLRRHLAFYERLSENRVHRNTATGKYLDKD